MNVGKQGVDLCSLVDDAVLRRRLLRVRPLAGLPRLARRALPAPARRDARRARRVASRPSRSGRGREGGLFLWATLPDYLDTTDLLARALQENVAFVPGRAAFLDGRGGVVDAAELLGRRRGRHPRGRSGASARSCASRSSCTARSPGARRRRRAPRRADGRATDNVVRHAAPRRMSTVAVLKGGRSLERNVSLTSGARVQDALERLGHDVVGDRRRARPRHAPARGGPGRRASSRCTAATARTARSRSCSRSSTIPYTGLGRVGVHPLRRQGARQARVPRRRAADARLLRVERGGVQGARAPPTRCRRSRTASTSRSSSSPRGRARRSGSSSRRRRPTCPGALVAAFSYDAKVLLERHVRRPRARGVGARRRGAADRRGDPARRGLLRLRGALRDRPHRLRLPRRRSTTRSTARVQRDRARRLRAARLRAASRASTSCSTPTACPQLLEINAVPGLTETSLLPQAAEAAGISFDALVARHRRARAAARV